MSGLCTRSGRFVVILLELVKSFTVVASEGASGRRGCGPDRPPPRARRRPRPYRRCARCSYDCHIPHRPGPSSGTAKCGSHPLAAAHRRSRRLTNTGRPGDPRRTAATRQVLGQPGRTSRVGARRESDGEVYPREMRDVLGDGLSPRSLGRAPGGRRQW